MFQKISHYAAQQIPFLFYTDYKGSKAHVYKLDELHHYGIQYAINAPYFPHQHRLNITPMPYQAYKTKFDAYISEIKKGNTYLGNLTQPTQVYSDLSLEEIFKTANAAYKLLVRDHFVCFSPEPFITIKNGCIHTFPMKGTIDASLPDAAMKILKNQKEMAEHTMIVDLLRNDLSIIAHNVKVERFRYIETISAGDKQLLHVSSHISGALPFMWQKELGQIIQKLLPAGSISGTPKKSTVTILDEIEGYERGYFSGIFGVFDGATLNSAVMIRFIEKSSKAYHYKSGGGITIESKAEDEYQEMLSKIYIP